MLRRQEPRKLAALPRSPCRWLPRKEDAPNKELEEACGVLPHAALSVSHRSGFCHGASLNQIITYDAFNMAEVFSRHCRSWPEAWWGSEWMSDDLYKRAAGPRKDFHVVERANHMSLYDVPQWHLARASGPWTMDIRSMWISPVATCWNAVVSF